MLHWCNIRHWESILMSNFIAGQPLLSLNSELYTVDELHSSLGVYFHIFAPLADDHMIMPHAAEVTWPFPTFPDHFRWFPAISDDFRWFLRYAASTFDRITWRQVLHSVTRRRIVYYTCISNIYENLLAQNRVFWHSEHFCASRFLY